jgi:hypothetical protein
MQELTGSQRTSLERALSIIEREVHRSKRPRLENDEPSDNAHAVQQARLGNGSRPLAQEITSTIYDPSSMPPPPTIPQPDLHPPETSFQIISPHSLGSNISQQTEGGNDHDNDLSNPVRLLAEAAEEGGPSVQPTIMAEPVLPLQYTLPETIHAMLHDGDVDPRVADLRSDTEYLAQGLEAMLSDTAQRSLTQEDMRFFKPARNQVKRDVGSEYDPVDLALVTLREVRVFLESFFNKLHPVLPVLDPILHTPECTW